MQRIFIRTFGCQMNEYDSERMAGILLKDKDFSIVNSEEEADFIIVNTCSVRQHAENRELSYIAKYVKNKKVIVAGCMAQNLKEELFKLYPDLYAILGTSNFSKIVDVIKNNKKILLDGEFDIYERKFQRPKRIDGLITIMQGCNNFCSYCIVPYVRGREKSREVNDIVKEIEDMVKQGYKEVMLLGQNVNSYYDEKTKTNFPQLLQKIHNIEGLLRIKFMTSHPKDLTNELIETVKKGEKFVKHFHLPVQSGSNKILKLMNRKYTKEEYIEKIEKIRSEIPFANITTDILVGFPGEEEKDFLETVDIINKLKFDDAFSFKYSVRKGTQAEKYGDTVKEKEKLRRLNYVIELQKKISYDINKSYIGFETEGLVYEISYKRKNELKTGTINNKKVFIKGDKNLIGKIVKVKLLELRGSSFAGILL